MSLQSQNDVDEYIIDRVEICMAFADTPMLHWRFCNTHCLFVPQCVLDKIMILNHKPINLPLPLNTHYSTFTHIIFECKFITC